MHVRRIAFLLLLSAVAAAQSAAPCPADRAVDDIIAEIHKQQSKMKARNKNPLPDFVCVFGWCRQSPKNPSPAGEPAPTPAAPAEGSNSSSSATPSGYSKCDEAMDRALEAAHDVDVGDTYFEEKNYRAAMMRYQDAEQQKAGDAAIMVRLGRAYEKLKEPGKALEQYQAAARLNGPEKWLDEARSGVTRLHGSGQ